MSQSVRCSVPSFVHASRIARISACAVGSLVCATRVRTFRNNSAIAYGSEGATSRLDIFHGQIDSTLHKIREKTSSEMIDRVFVNALVADGSKVNLAVRDGRFVSIESDCPPADTTEVIDLQEYLVLPGFVDGHIHLDKSFVGDRWHSHESVTSLRERLAVEKKELALAPPIAERAHALISQAAAFGTMAMRSHVDVDATTGLTNLQAAFEELDRPIRLSLSPLETQFR
jgi:amidohydrolase family protein